MNAETFFAHFGHLTDTPNGVQKLRELALQLAVTGRLGLNRPGESAPAVTTDRSIEASKSLMSRTHRSAPFEVPANWRFELLGRLVSKMGAGSTPLGGRKVYVDDGVIFLRSQNVWNDGLKLVDVARIDPDIHAKMLGTHVKPGDILLNITGASIGRSAIVPNTVQAANVSQHVAILRLIDSAYCKFLHLCVISPYFQQRIMDVQVGVSREGLSMSRLRLFPVPLPPLAEQQRIVAKVDELMALCDTLEAKQQRQREVRVAATTAALSRLTSAGNPADFAHAWSRATTHFDRLFDTPQTISQLRQAILQLAVMGKLARSTEDYPHLPLSALLREDSLNGYSKTPLAGPPGVPLLRISAGTSRRDATVDEGDYKFGNLTTSEIDRFSLKAGDLLACRFNGNLRFVGKFSLYRAYSESVQVFPDKLIRYRVDQQKAIPEYVRYAMNAPVTRQVIEAMCATTAGNIGISAGRLKTVEIPVPSILVQRQIVATIDAMYSLCDVLDSRLSARQSTDESLTSAMVQTILNQPLSTVARPEGSSSTGELHRNRAAILARLVQRLKECPQVGSVHLAKTFYAAITHTDLNMGIIFQRQKAGPLWTGFYPLRNIGKREGWLNYTTGKGEGESDRYGPGPNIAPLLAHGDSLLADQGLEFDRVLDLFATLDTRRAELFATAYAVWNDFLIRGQAPSEAEIIKDFRENWHAEKGKFKPTEIRQGLAWLREHDLVPKGRGKATQGD